MAGGLFAGRVTGVAGSAPKEICFFSKAKRPVGYFFLDDDFFNDGAFRLLLASHCRFAHG